VNEDSGLTSPLESALELYTNVRQILYVDVEGENIKMSPARFLV